MSEAFEKVKGLTQIPVFPLPLVMMPNEMLPLHIFEDRYRRMLKDVAEERSLFGISYFEPNDSFSDRPQTGTIGCVAEIKESEMLPDGRSNIITRGVIRYRLLDYVDAGTPYFMGDIAFFEDEPDDETATGVEADSVYNLFTRIAQAAYKLGGNRGSLPEIERVDPETMSFMVPAAFNFENALKYELLEMTSTVERLQKLKMILSQLATQMEQNAEAHKTAQTNGHSKKKIDF